MNTSRTIQQPSGPYITVHDHTHTFSIQLNQHGNLHVHLDKKILPELIQALSSLLPITGNRK